MRPHQPNRGGDRKSNPVYIKQYICQPTAKRFHETTGKLVRGIRGPRNSGKSVSMVWDIFMRAQAIPPMIGTNIRSSAWLIVAKTYNRIQDTALKEWSTWFGKPMTQTWLGNRPRAEVDYSLPDGTRVEMDLLFAAADDPLSAAQFKSMQMTGAWLVEASEISDETVLSMMIDTVQRYPAKRDGGDNGLGGVIMDTNAMSTNHWWYRKEAVERPANWEFYVQPPALLEVPGSNPPQFVPNLGQGAFPPAENIENLNGGHQWYMDRIAGKSVLFTRVYFCNEFGELAEGVPIYQNFNDQLHAEDTLEVYRGLPLVMCADFGRTPAISFAQMDPRGQLRIIDEIITKDFSMRKCARELLVPRLRNEYFGMSYMAFGENSGGSRGQQNDKSCFDEFYDATGIHMDPASTNLQQPRWEAVRYFLDMRDGFKISRRKCPIAYEGFLGKYCMDQTGMEEKGVYGQVRDNIFTHVADSVQVAALWARGRSLGRVFEKGQWQEAKTSSKGPPRQVVTGSDPAGWS